jgi:ubiquinone/menaquinone biosynthesis C-methylase UbiE
LKTIGRKKTMGRKANQAAITRFWNEVAPYYESHPGNTAATGSAEYELWSKLYERYLPRPPSDVLDVSTGTGFSALICAAHGHRVTGIHLSQDRSFATLEQAGFRGIHFERLPTEFEGPEEGHQPYLVVAYRADGAPHSKPD